MQTFLKYKKHGAFLPPPDAAMVIFITCCCPNLQCIPLFCINCVLWPRKVSSLEYLCWAKPYNALFDSKLLIFTRLRPCKPSKWSFSLCLSGRKTSKWSFLHRLRPPESFKWNIWPYCMGQTICPWTTRGSGASRKPGDMIFTRRREGILPSWHLPRHVL